MEDRPWGTVVHDLRDRIQGLEGPDLVVHEDDRHEGDVVIERARQGIQIDDPSAIDGNDSPPEPGDGVEDGVVLDRAAHHRAVASAEDPGDREVVGLGAAAREHELAGLAAHDIGQLLAGGVERGPGRGAPARGRRTGSRPRPASAGTIAASASGRSGVVAAWSR